MQRDRLNRRKLFFFSALKKVCAQPTLRERISVMMASIGRFVVSCSPSFLFVFPSQKTDFVGLLFC